jgi:hypothetical protein
MSIFYEKSVMVFGSYRNEMFPHMRPIVESRIIFFVKLDRWNIVNLFLRDRLIKHLKIYILSIRFLSQIEKPYSISRLTN